jgi:uncharacterized protein YigE (DUF2233 family)
MLLKNYYRLSLLLCLLMFFLASCDLIPPVTVNGTPVITTGNSTPDHSGTSQLNVWSKVAPGVELRYEDWKSPAGDDDTVAIARFDLHHVRLSVEYQPTHPRFMSDWMHKEQATAIINGGYFDQQNRATGLVISNGHVSGTSYSGFGGMLVVDEQGHVRLRYLAQHPYNPNERLKQAAQSAPMLVLPGGKRARFSANAASSRRSVAAMDRQGRLLFIVSPGMVFTLDELADQLVKSDLSINVALNLDGGASTGLYMNAGSQHVAIDSPAQLPIVIIVRQA